MIREYLKRIIPLIYFSIFFFRFKKLHIKAVLFLSVRIEGKRYISIGRNSIVQRGGWLLALKIMDIDPVLSIGNNCSVGDYSHITAVKNVTIEDNVLIANNVYISDNTHDYKNIAMPIQNQSVLHKRDVKLGEGCWIGENVCIIGASVGKNSVIGANSVVTNDIGDFCVAVGIPAKVVKRYDWDKKDWVNI